MESIENLQRSNHELAEKVSDLQTQLAQAKTEIEWFKTQFKLNRQRLYGRASERSDTLQLPLPFFSELTPAEETSQDTETIHYTRRKKRQTFGRQIDTSNLPRDVCQHDLAETDKTCCDCGRDLHCIGEDRSEQLDYIPAQIKVIEHVTPKYACRACHTVRQAKKPEAPITKCLAGARLLTAVIINKYEHHLPLYRQAKMFKQQGVSIADNTLTHWVMQVGQRLLPLGIALWDQLLKSHSLQVDETTLNIVKKKSKGYLWAYHGCDPGRQFIVFELRLTRKADIVKERLKKFKGLIQTDGYSGYQSFQHTEGVVHFACWDHARRKFVEVVKVTQQTPDSLAHRYLRLIQQLYRIEAKARAFKLTHDHRKQLRYRHAKPILHELEQLLTSYQPAVPPKSALGKAIQYSLKLWPSLTRYVEYGEAEISNIQIENQIRPIALGRRNWLFVNNKASGQISALLYSLIQTCKLNQIDPSAYLNYVLTQVHAMRRGEVDPTHLLPQFIDKSLLTDKNA